ASQMSLEEWSDGPGATVSVQALEDLVAMFRAYERGGLVGDGAPLERLLGRPGTTWRGVLEREVAARATLRP
ncbi:MAG: hypothetical protein LOY02_18280, partial [Intrasporangium sp.]|nr:hypothetical protein [Intrasporangium sp.]